MTRVAIASDHGGFALKAQLTAALKQWGVPTEDLGTHAAAVCDYPDFAHLLARGIEEGRFDLGVLLCGTGVGMSIAANRHEAIRAAAVSDPYSAQMARMHNHANVLCLGGRVLGDGLALMILRAWLDAEPSAEARHMRRLAKLGLPNHSE